MTSVQQKQTFVAATKRSFSIRILNSTEATDAVTKPTSSHDEKCPVPFLSNLYCYI
jgi:hypothetical protein